MFLVKDSVAERREKIESFLNDGEPSIALLLAVIDLERTLRRSILALGCTSTKELNARMGVSPTEEGRLVNTNPKRGPIRYRSNLDGLHEAWKHEVQPRLGRKLPGDLSPGWPTVKEAVKLRNELVHGSRGPTSIDFTETRIEAVLDLIGRLHEVAKDDGHDLQKPVRRRLKDRTK